jgi:hypothetical protein
MRANWRKLELALNALVVLALILSFAAGPATAQAPDRGERSPGEVQVKGPELQDVTQLTVTVNPSTATAPAYYRMDFNIVSAVEATSNDYLAVRFPDEVNVPDDINTQAVAVAQASVEGDLDGAKGENAADIRFGDEFGGSHQVLRVYVATQVNDWIKLEFFGPEWTDPSTEMPDNHENAGLNNPDTLGTYEICVWTSEEAAPQACDNYGITAGPPVQLYIKKQVPMKKCGYSRLEYVQGFEADCPDGPIQAALDMANHIWEGNSVDFPTWNLFDDCPTLEGDIEDWLMTNDLLDDVQGVPVGALIKVAPGTYNETLYMDTPGVILASRDGRATTIIDAEGISPEVLGTNEITGAVAIEAGGVTFGASTIQEEDGVLELGGFTVQNAGKLSGDDDDAHGVAVYPHGQKCQDSLIYSSTVKSGGYFTVTASNFAVVGSKSITTTIDVFEQYDKIVNLSNQWSVHISDTTEYEGEPAYTTDITVTDHFTEGDVVAVFAPKDSCTDQCEEARVDVRENMLQNNTLAGIGVKEAAVWVDGNEACGNVTDGFYGEDLQCCGVVVCDGIERSENALEISNNYFHDNGDGSADDWTGEEDCFTMEGDGGDDSGIHIVSTDDECTCPEEMLYIMGNDLSANAHAGLWLGRYAAECEIDIEENELLDNGVFGLSNETDRDYDDDGEIDVIFKYNDIDGNGSWGVKNWVNMGSLSGFVWFNAKENYWGWAGGPSAGPEPCSHEYDQRSEALGYGDAVSEYVYYNPWLSVSYETVLDDGIRYYGSDTLELQAGWNTLAVPLQLYDGLVVTDPADSVGGVDELGDFLQDALAIYRYNPGTGLYEGPPFDFEACRGYVIKMDEPSRFPVLYSSKLGLPSFDMDPGWNLVGSAFGIDRHITGTDGITGTVVGQGRWAVADPDVPDEEARLEVDEALDSIKDQASTIISPSAPGQIDMWSSSYAAEAAADPGHYMYTGEAYWVFMTDSGTLAGREATPLYLTD